MSPVTSGDIIPLLQRLQGAYGYLPKDIVLAVCEETGLPASRVFGVATFYSQFSLDAPGQAPGPVLQRDGLPRTGRPAGHGHHREDPGRHGRSKPPET